MMNALEVYFQGEWLIFPAVKRAVAGMASAAAWGYVLLAALWLLGLVPVLLWEGETMPVAAAAFLVLSAALRTLLAALLLFTLYMLALWGHHVLLAGRGLAATRWILLLLLPMLVLHLLCEACFCLSGAPLLVNQALLPVVLYTSLATAVALNWFCMAALPLRLRLLLLCFAWLLVVQYVLAVPVLLLLLPCVGFPLLRRLACMAPRVVSLPPRETSDK